MGWTTTTFERETIYREVWADPVRTVAKRYNISDVGFRKICRKLGVPLPPLGYWAKVAAGKNPRVVPLPTKHSGPTQYDRRILVDERASESSQRREQLLASTAPKSWPTVTVKDSATDVHEAVRRCANRIGSRARLPTGLYEVRAHDVFSVRVSEAQKDRALRVIDAVLVAALAAGARLVPGKRDGVPIHLELMGQCVRLRVDEEVHRTQREPTAAEKAKQLKEPWYRPDLSVFSPTGKLKLSATQSDETLVFLTASDGVRAPLERRLENVLPRLWTAVAGHTVKVQIFAEEHERWQQQWAKRQAWEAARQAELDRLKATEERAQRWRRAADLRNYAAALERAGTGPLGEANGQALRQELEWVRNAADWLDPLLRKHWAAVEGYASEAVDPDDLEQIDDDVPE